MRDGRFQKWAARFPALAMYIVIVLLPGGTLVALLLWLVQRARRSAFAASFRAAMPTFARHSSPAVEVVCVAGAVGPAIDTQTAQTVQR